MKYLQAKLTTICSFKLVTIRYNRSSNQNRTRIVVWNCIDLTGLESSVPCRYLSYQISPFWLRLVALGICVYICGYLIKLSLSLVSIEIKLWLNNYREEKTEINRPEVVGQWQAHALLWDLSEV